MLPDKRDVESGVELFARLRERANVASVIPELFANGTFGTNGVLEINGRFGSGKSVLLLEIVSRCILNMEYGGCGGEVVFFDILNQLDINRLQKLLRFEIRKKVQDSSSVDKSLSESLARLKVKRTYSTAQLFLELYNLEQNLNIEKISLICFDNVTAFYWLARHQFPAPVANQNQFFQKLAAVISRISRESGIPFIITRQILFRNQRSYDSEWTSRNPGKADAQAHSSTTRKNNRSDFMGKIWSKVPTIRMSLQKVPKTQDCIAIEIDAGSFSSSASMQINSDFTIFSSTVQNTDEGLDDNGN